MVTYNGRTVQGSKPGGGKFYYTNIIQDAQSTKHKKGNMSYSCEKKNPARICLVPQQLLFARSGLRVIPT
jgi:hypothetical protein